MGWLKDNPRLSALALASALVILGWIAFGGPLPHWPEHDQAAWVQAYGSIAAIIASVVLAIWVPIHMRAVGEHDVVQRAINSAVVACGGVRGVWEATHGALAERTFDRNTEVLLGVQLDFAREALKLVPPSMLMGASYEAVVGIALKHKMIEVILRRLSSEADPFPMGLRIGFPEVFGELDAVSRLLEGMVPRRISGHWMIYSPTDDVPDAALDR